MKKRIWKDDDKFRYFQFVVYPESAPEGWRAILKDSHMSFAISPLHDEDYDDNGKLKKPHHHVIFHTAGNNPWTVKRATRVLAALEVPANGYVEPCFDAGSCQRYLIHLDDPAKQQFDGGRTRIDLLNNFPLDLTRELTKEEVLEVRRAIFNVINVIGIDEYADLLDYLLWELGDDDMHSYACNHTILFKGYLDSKRNSGKMRNAREVNNG